MEISKTFLNCRVAVKIGDITKEQIDAIVNAANGTLMGGGGVDGAIHRAGGPEILKQCKEIRAKEFPQGLPTGHAVITTAGRMPAKRVIHTVGPVYEEEAVTRQNCWLRPIVIVSALPLSTDSRLSPSPQYPPVSMAILSAKQPECHPRRLKNFSDQMLRSNKFG